VWLLPLSSSAFFPSILCVQDLQSAQQQCLSRLEIVCCGDFEGRFSAWDCLLWGFEGSFSAVYWVFL
jgi:hypothetical protein